MKKAHVTNCPHVSYVALTRIDKHKTSIKNGREASSCHKKKAIEKAHRKSHNSDELWFVEEL